MEKEEFLATLKKEKTVEEIRALAKENDIELTDDELEAAAGGTFTVLSDKPSVSLNGNKSAANGLSEKNPDYTPTLYPHV